MKKLQPNSPRPEKPSGFVTTLYLSLELKEQVDAETERLNMSRTEFFRNVLNLYFEDEEE